MKPPVRQTEACHTVTEVVQQPPVQSKALMTVVLRDGFHVTLDSQQVESAGHVMVVSLSHHPATTAHL